MCGIGDVVGDVKCGFCEYGWGDVGVGVWDE